MDINKITYIINGAIFEVNRILGPEFLEKVYENALVQELRSRGLKAESQRPVKVHYKGQVIGEYFADIMVGDAVIIELKTVDHLDRVHQAQMLNYLKATGIKVGLLVNFKQPKAEIKRIVMDLPEWLDGQPVATSATGSSA
jgi:GxxExxY protein